MKKYVIFDSIYGNTKKIAKIIADNLDGEVELLAAKGLKFDDLDNFDLLVIGTPTHGGMPTENIRYFIKSVPSHVSQKNNALQNKKIAIFDTRIDIDKQNLWLKIIMKLSKYAAPKINKLLKHREGEAVVEPEGFIVEGKEGPLKEGEIERAKRWVQEINKKLQ